MELARILQVVFVGTGVCIVTAGRRFPSILVEVGEEDVILDAGPGTARALAEMGYSTSDVRYLLLTHLHLDDTNDYVLDRLNEIAPDKILLTTNVKFRPAFESWLASKHLTNVELVVEQSRSENEKLGAVGALAQLSSRRSSSPMITSLSAATISSL